MLKVKNWHKFQHFKDRRPPWIKLYRDVLDDIKWHELDGDSAKSLVMLWLIASENDGILPDSKELAFRLRTSKKSIESIISKLSHWLYQDDIKTISDINAISDEYQSDALETEIETETETAVQKPSRKKTKSQIPEGLIISDGIRDWAAKNGYSKIDERFEHFVGACKAKAYEYADWDAAFRNAIIGDWAKLGKQNTTSSKSFDMDEFLRSK